MIQANFAPNQATSQPSFEEFTVKYNEPASTVPLNPNAAILDTEIQQITPEEFGRTISAAQQVTEDLRKLKLPRSWKDLVDTLTQTITSTKRSKSIAEIDIIPQTPSF